MIGAKNIIAGLYIVVITVRVRVGLWWSLFAGFYVDTLRGK